MTSRLLATLAACLVLGACMGVTATDDTTPPDGEDPVVPGGPITDAQRMAAFDAVNAQVGHLTGSDWQSRQQQMVTWLLGRPEFEDAGANTDGSTWARFNDGRILLLLIVPDSTGEYVPPSVAMRHATRGPARAIPPTAARAASGATAQRPSEIPRSDQARVMVGGAFPGERNIVPEVTRMLTGAGYTIASNEPSASIDDLRVVRGDGFFYYSAHGGSGKSKLRESVYGVTSSTIVNPNTEQRYASDWNNDRLVYAKLYTPGLRAAPGSEVTVYAINEKFIIAHWDFSEGSIVYIAACSAGHADAQAFLTALRRRAGVVIAWNGAFWAPDDHVAAKYLIDRLVGRNEHEEEAPHQRPFDYASILADMEPLHKDRSYWPVQGFAKLTAFPGDKGPAGLLVPSIKHMDMDESSNTLVLNGQFGSDIPVVTMNGSASGVSLLSWGPERIAVNIPASGPQSAGNVVVKANDRKSNARTLSDWRGALNLSFRSGEGDQKWEGPINLHLRADVHSYREEAGQRPVSRWVPVQIARDTDGHLTASGSAGTAGSRVFWEGRADLAARSGNPLAANPIDGVGEIDTDGRKLRIALFVTALHGMEVRHENSGIRAPLPAGWGYGEDGPVAPWNPLPSMHLPLTQTFTIMPGQRRLPEPLSPVLSWGAIQPTHAPQDTMPRVTARVGQAARAGRAR
jgi:hypothetical protein